MSLGLRRGTVFVEPHDSEWKTIAAETIIQTKLSCSLCHMKVHKLKFYLSIEYRT